MSTHSIALRVPRIHLAPVPAPSAASGLFAAVRGDGGLLERALGIALVASAALPATFFALAIAAY